MKRQIYINGNFVPEDEAKISIFDQGFLHGDGIYETLRVYNGKIAKLEAHIKRLFNSALGLEIPITLSLEQWREALLSLLEINRMKDALLRITVSRGPGIPGQYPTKDAKPTIVVIPILFHGYPENMYIDGIQVYVVSVRRNSIRSIPPKLKVTSLLNNILARMEAQKMGGEEAILLNLDGYISEGAASNVFFVKNGVVKTPGVDVGILWGVTRDVVIQLLKNEKIIVEEGLYRIEEMKDSEEVFLTSTTREIMPVVRVDETVIGKGSPGEMTKKIHKLYRKEVLNETS